MIETLNLRIDKLCGDGQQFSHDREVSMVTLRMANTLTQSVEYLLTDTYHKSTVGGVGARITGKQKQYIDTANSAS